VFRVEAEREVGDKEESGLDLWKRVLSVLSERSTEKQPRNEVELQPSFCHFFLLWCSQP